jgi:RNA polymerase sigma factor (sigma-70 family)
MQAEISAKSKSISKKKPREIVRYPWPRTAADDESVHLGIDIIKKRPDIIKLVHKFFHVDGIAMEELLQEVYLAIMHKNYSKSAHDPRKSSFGHYVYMIANNVCINLVHKKKRYDKEKDSIYESAHEDEDAPIIETAEAVDQYEDEYDSEKLEDFEIRLRRKGLMDLARYIRAARTGASNEIIREALSYGDKSITVKKLREMRYKVTDLVNSRGFLASN